MCHRSEWEVQYQYSAFCCSWALLAAVVADPWSVAA